MFVQKLFDQIHRYTLSITMFSSRLLVIVFQPVSDSFIN